MNIQHRPTAHADALDFDDAGEVVPSVGFQYPGDGEAETSEADAARLRQETMLALLRFLATGRADARRVGVRVLLLLHLLNRGDTTRADLAKRLHVSRQRVHQCLTKLQRELPRLSALAQRHS